MENPVIYRAENVAGEIVVVRGKNLPESFRFLLKDHYTVAHSKEVLKVEEAGVIDHDKSLYGLVNENVVYSPGKSNILSKDGILFSPKFLGTASAAIGFKNYVPLPEEDIKNFIELEEAQGRILKIPRGRVSLSADPALSTFLFDEPLSPNSSRSLDSLPEPFYTPSASFILYDKKHGGDFVVGPRGNLPVIGYRPLQ